MSYLDIANSPILYAIAALILSLLVIQSLWFFFMARKRALALGVSSQVISKAVKASIITSIIPSVAIIIGLISLSGAMGVPISWARLSMAGSLMYELTAASIGAQTMGVTLGGDGYTAQAFANSVWLMTIGIVPAYFWAVLFLRKYKASIKKSGAKDMRLQNLVIVTMLVCVYVSFVIPAISSGSNGILAVGVAAVVMAIMTYLVAKKNQHWLREYALSISMIAAIGAVIIVQ